MLCIFEGGFSRTRFRRLHALLLGSDLQSDPERQPPIVQDMLSWPHVPQGHVRPPPDRPGHVSWTPVPEDMLSASLPSLRRETSCLRSRDFNRWVGGSIAAGALRHPRSSRTCCPGRTFPREQCRAASLPSLRRETSCLRSRDFNRWALRWGQIWNLTQAAAPRCVIAIARRHWSARRNSPPAWLTLEI